VPEAFSQELDCLKSRNSRDSVTRRDTTTRSYASSNSPGHESVVVELYHCGYVEKVRHDNQIRMMRESFFSSPNDFLVCVIHSCRSAAMSDRGTGAGLRSIKYL